MVVNLTLWLVVFSGERASERAEKPRGEWEKGALYNYPVPGVQVVETARRDVSRKNGEVRGRGESLSHASTSPYLSPALFAQHSTISTPGIGYDYKETARLPKASQEQD